MYAIVDRICGKELGTISDQDLHVLQDVLCDEGPFDTDYYLQEGMLELLSQAGLSPDAMVLLRDSLEHRQGELEFGWEKRLEGETAVIGRIMENGGLQPAAGCKVEFYREHRNEFWCFSRDDGRFEAVLEGAEGAAYQLRVSGLEDVELWLGEVDVEPGVTVDLGTLEVAHQNPPEPSALDDETIPVGAE